MKSKLSQLSPLVVVVISVGLLLAVTTDGSTLRSQRFLQETPNNNDVEDINGTDATVVGGDDASSGEFPFFARFGDGSCGGTLIAPDRVLTAAHCVNGGAPSTVRIGGIRAAFGTTKFVCCSVTHPDWDPSDPFKNDIAILKLCCPINNVDEVTLNTNTAVPVGGDDVQVVGFGQTSSGGGTGIGSNKLQKLTYSAVSDADCKSSWGDAVTEGLHVCVQNTNSEGVSKPMWFCICLFSTLFRDVYAVDTTNIHHATYFYARHASVIPVGLC